jgi:ATP-dependent protease ClpP protease subunit
MSRFELKARGGLRAELRIYGDIGQAWDAEESNDARTVAEKLQDLSGELDVRINSFGGSVADGLAIYNALRRYKGRVTTHIDGVAYSIASLIAMGGQNIRMAENAMMMIHAPWGMAIGNAVQLRDMADVMDKHAEAMLKSYVRDGGPGEDTLRAWLTDGKDHYFNSSEAKVLGLVDEVTEAEPMADIAAALRGSSYRVPERIQGREQHDHEDRQVQVVIHNHLGAGSFNPAASAASTPEATMANENPAAGETQAASNDKTDVLASHNRTVQAAKVEGARAEAKRRKIIDEVFAGFYDGDPLSPYTTLRNQCLDDVNCDELQARRKLTEALAARTQDPIVARESYGMEQQPARPPRASQHLGGAMFVGRDAVDKRSEGLTAALRIKAGLEMDRAKIDAERKGEFLSMSLTDIMAIELRAAGYTVGGMREDIARNYLNALPLLAAGPSHGTDHLPAVLGNIANLGVMQGWEASEETWQQWTQAGTLSNYQTHTRANLALLDKLQKMRENQEWEYGDMADVKQTIRGDFHGKRYSLSIQAIVNDDLGELGRAMAGWGEAANATVGDAVFAVLTAPGTGGLGQVMDEDNKVLFHADHSNYVASGAGAPPDEAGLNTARAAMVAQTDQNGRTVAVRPRFILHGPGLFSTVYKLLNSQELTEVVTVGGDASVTSGASNSARAMNLTPVEEYRFTGLQWLLAAARRTVEVAGVGGPVTPRANQSTISNVPGMTYELSMPFGVAALDFRGLRYNHGA